MAIAGGGTAVAKIRSKALQQQGTSGNLAEEAVASIRTATAFGIQDKLATRYEERLAMAQTHGFHMRSAAGLMFGVATAIIYMKHALTFLQGSRFLVGGTVSLGAVITIQLAMMMGGAWLGQALPHLQALSSAIAAAEKIFGTIDRKSAIQSHTDAGTRLDHVDGRIEFQDVRLVYPTRPEAVLPKFRLTIPAGKVTAIVGPSGCGKSSLISLLERFYMPVSGLISLDGNEISTLNLQWLRRQMALVSQEPVLFNATMFQNIEYGLIGTKHEKVSSNGRTGFRILTQES